MYLASISYVFWYAKDSCIFDKISSHILHMRMTFYQCATENAASKAISD